MNIVEFEQQLASQDRHYDNLTPLNHGYVHIRFSGPFNQQTIIWDAHLYSLAYYINNIKQAESSTAKQFIWVGDENELGREIKIALNVPVIDEPTIRKSMIMVRQYKRLILGRHEYGDEITL